LRNKFTNRKNNPEKVRNHIGAQKAQRIMEFQGRLKAFTA
jgi:hypothetical protein